MVLNLASLVNGININHSGVQNCQTGQSMHGASYITILSDRTKIFRPLKRTELSDRTIYIRGQLYNDFVRQDKIFQPLKRTELPDRTIYIRSQLYNDFVRQDKICRE